MRNKRVFLICPVRIATDEETVRIEAYVATLEDAGYSVHWPARDTNQNDDTGVRICIDNTSAIRAADVVLVWYNPNSQGSLFDIGAAFALRKTIRLANREQVELLRTPGKSFVNVLLALDDAHGNYYALLEPRRSDDA